MSCSVCHAFWLVSGLSSVSAQWFPCEMNVTCSFPHFSLLMWSQVLLRSLFCCLTEWPWHGVECCHSHCLLLLPMCPPPPLLCMAFILQLFKSVMYKVTNWNQVRAKVSLCLLFWHSHQLAQTWGHISDDVQILDLCCTSIVDFSFISFFCHFPLLFACTFVHFKLMGLLQMGNVFTLSTEFPA